MKKGKQDSVILEDESLYFKSKRITSLKNKKHVDRFVIKTRQKDSRLEPAF